MSNFSWYEEEDLGGPEPLPEPPRPPQQWPRWLLLIFLGVIIAGSGGGVLYRQASSRIAEVSFAQESAVRTSQALVYRAAQQQDAELFVTLLSGRDANWAAAQEALVGAGLLYARPGFDLIWLPQDGATAVSAITFNPELNTAVLTATHHYAVAIGNGLTQTVMLQETAVYRSGIDRWLLSPPDAEFWGETLTAQGAHLTFRYPARDTAVAQRLAADLDEKIGEMCARLPDLRCPSDLHLNLTLSTNPASLYETNKQSGTLLDASTRVRSFSWYNFRGSPDPEDGLEELILPAPSLFGFPQDDASYQAAYRGYAARVLSALIADLVGWECCWEIAYFQATLDWQLAQLGLRPWPLQPADYAAALGKNISEMYQAGLQGDSAPLQIMVAFFVEELGVPVVALQRHLAQPVETDWQNWLWQEGGVSFDSMEEFNRAWLAFLVKRAQLVQSSHVSLPQGKLQLVCQPDGSEYGNLYAYYPQTGEMVMEQELGWETAVLHPLPDRSGVIVADARGRNRDAVGVPFVWQFGQVWELPGLARAIPLENDPQGNLTLFSWEGDNFPVYIILNTSACLAGGVCESQTLIGAANWSPSGQRLIMASSLPGRDVFMLFLADNSGQLPRYFGIGRDESWLDEETLLFILEEGEVVYTEIESLEKTPLFTATELLRGLDNATFSLPELRIEYVVGQPDNPQRLLVMAADGNSHYLFDTDLAAQNVRLLQAAPGKVLPLPAAERFSPDGRWLVQLLSFELEAETETKLQLLDWQTAVSQSYPMAPPDLTQPARLVDWSADGQWLALVSGGYVRLISPEYEVTHWFVPPGMACDQGVWVAKS